MSNLAKILTPTLTGERKYVLPSISIKWEETKPADISVSSYSVEYKLETEIKVKYFVADFFKTDIEAVHKRMKGQLIEDVFGEFRSNFFELDNAIYAGDLKQARTALDKFYNKMFLEGI